MSNPRRYEIRRAMRNGAVFIESCLIAEDGDRIPYKSICTAGGIGRPTQSEIAILAVYGRLELLKRVDKNIHITIHDNVTALWEQVLESA